MSSYMIEHGFRRPSNMEMTPVDQLVIPETSQKKDKQKVRITDDKQIKNQQNLMQKHQPKISKRIRNHLNLRLHKYKAVREEQEQI
ncbi:hypothetical protein GLOIN_2v1871772 [Rhizophagus irregularis DAOM 181602=DAOM 197198]|uniref:Uncharacterized protein n=1 Tax=Rhizophagus irregularis (strain DAOM 197198w) TaxID=1432141 RepID=A0A015KWR8_RHIIW|nr:hypothetical protein RirG_142460 [Rhizophagus irregularis DAOM 197198w]GET52602.1 hypothetical protein GLOIN_2v1871772 [Rhizophagus irregularis DAOM 181602=DAOM 197198]